MSAAGALAEWLAPKRTALLVIDIQVDFASPDGALGKMGLDLSSVPAAIAATNRLTVAARAANVPVVFIGLATTEETDSPAWKERMRRMGEAAEDGMALCRKGEPGSEFYGVLPQPSDQIVHKTKYSGFYGTDLDGRLKALDVDTLVVTGLTTECCVDCTVRDAFHRDYHVFLPADSCAAYGEDIHKAAIANLNLNCDIPTDSAAVVAAWSGYARG